MKLLCSVAAITLSAGPLLAQCRVGKETNEAKLLAYYAAPLAFSPSGSLEQMNPGSVRLAFELTYIPEPDDDLRRTSICFLPKEENSQLSPVLPRPRVAMGLPGGLFLEGTYLPPVTVAEATPNMASIALGFVRRVGQALGVALRAHATVGRVRGPITCPEDILQLSDPDAACYGTSESSDTYRPNIAGVEAALTWMGSERYAGYAGAGFSSMRPRFQVGFQPSNAPFDSTRVEVDLDRISLMVGGRMRISTSLGLTAELYAVPEDVALIRVGGTWRVR
jgi:hypothetical protein